MVLKRRQTSVVENNKVNSFSNLEELKVHDVPWQRSLLHSVRLRTVPKSLAPRAGCSRLDFLALTKSHQPQLLILILKQHDDYNRMYRDGCMWRTWKGLQWWWNGLSTSFIWCWSLYWPLWTFSNKLRGQDIESKMLFTTDGWWSKTEDFDHSFNVVFRTKASTSYSGVPQSETSIMYCFYLPPIWSEQNYTTF